MKMIAAILEAITAKLLECCARLFHVVLNCLDFDSKLNSELKQKLINYGEDLDHGRKVFTNVQEKFLLITDIKIMTVLGLKVTDQMILMDAVYCMGMGANAPTYHMEVHYFGEAAKHAQHDARLFDFQPCKHNKLNTL